MIIGGSGCAQGGRTVVGAFNLAVLGMNARER
jgi:hypothetical protein